MTVLWGARRRDTSYHFITAEEAVERHESVIGMHDFRRLLVTVIRRAF